MHCLDMAHMVADAAQLLDQMTSATGDATPLPVYVLGHSIGGLLATLLASQLSPGQVAAVAITGPCIQLGAAMDDTLAQVVLPVAAALLPTLRVAGPPAEHLARNSAVVQQYLRDPLNSASCTLAFVSSMLKAQKRALAQAGNISAPMLILHGGADQVCALAGSEALVLAMGGREAELRLVHGGYHEILNDHGFEDHVTSIAQWFLGVGSVGAEAGGAQ
jgi:alpha-beta hydrolase superfamily lysophospholipase